MAKLEFKFSRVKVMVEGIPIMVVESMARDIKVLCKELRTAVIKNNKLKGSLAELRTEIKKVKARMENIHATEERGGEQYTSVEQHALGKFYDECDIYKH